VAGADALNGREPREREEIAERIHPDVLVEKHVELQRLDQLARGQKVARHVEAVLGVAPDEAREIVVDRRREENRRHFQLLARELREQSAAGSSDAVIVKELRDEPDANSRARTKRCAAVRRYVIEHRKEMAIHRRGLGLQGPIGLTVIGPVEIRPQRQLQRIVAGAPGPRQQRIHCALDVRALGGDDLARRDYRRDDGRLLDATRDRGLQRVRAAIGFEGALGLPERLLDDAEIFPVLSDVRPQRAGGLQFHFRHRETPEFLQRCRVLLMDYRLARRQLDGLDQDRARGIVRAGVQREQAQSEPRVRLRGLDPEELLVRLLRFAQALRPMRALRRREQPTHLAQMCFAAKPPGGLTLPFLSQTLCLSPRVVAIPRRVRGSAGKYLQ